MNIPRRHFLKLVACATALPAVPRNALAIACGIAGFRGQTAISVQSELALPTPQTPAELIGQW